MRNIFVLTTLFFCLSAIAQTKVEIPEDLSIKADHPRLMIDKKDFSQMSKSISTCKNAALIKMHDAYMQVASSSVEKSEPFQYEVNASGKLLNVSRKALLELGACSYAYRYTNDKRYLHRASTILEDVCSFHTWNPQHYLDVAEMALGVSIAYDWLYAKLSPSVRHMCEKAIKQYFFDTATSSEYIERFRAKNNWGQVLNAALVCSSIAFYDMNPIRSQELIRRAVNDNLLSIERGYAPDGIYPEGAMYWGYGTSFQIMTNEALYNTYGSDFGLSGCKGFRESADFMIFACGNIGKAFNYSDSSEKRKSVPSLWYFASRLGNNDIVYNEFNNIVADKKFNYNNRTGFIHIYHASLCHIDDIKAPGKTVFYGYGTNPLVIARTGWDRNHIYLGAKGGTPRNGHAHMDAGSFVYEDRGVRWVREPSAPGYSKTESLLKKLGGSLWRFGQESLRWKLFGYNNAQHSTLTINGKDQLCSGMATLVEVYDTEEKKGGLFDLSTIYATEVKEVKRSVYIAENEWLEVEDQVSALDSKDAEVRWNIPTDAEVEATPEGVILSIKGKKMMLSAEGASVSYTTDMQMPANVPVEFEQFYNTAIKFAAFTFTVPAGQSITVKTTLKRIN